MMTLISCESESQYQEQAKRTDFTYSDGMGTYELKVYEFNGCQYLGKLTGSQSDVLTHLGNCNNPNHKK